MFRLFTLFFFSSRRRHTRCALVTGVQTCALPICYDQIMTLSAATPAALVDMAGNGAVTRVVHSHFGNNLKESLVVGKSHWDAQAEVAGLPGPERQGFFAPGRSQKGLADWVGTEFEIGRVHE